MKQNDIEKIKAFSSPENLLFGFSFIILLFLTLSFSLFQSKCISHFSFLLLFFFLNGLGNRLHLRSDDFHKSWGLVVKFDVKLEGLRAAESDSVSDLKVSVVFNVPRLVNHLPWLHLAWNRVPVRS